MFSDAIKPKVGIIVQARLGSKRLPQKIFKQLTPEHIVLEYLLKRLSNCHNYDCLVVATTKNLKDNVLAEWLDENNYLYYRGDEANCLKRYCETCNKFNIDIIVRITSDCPLVIPEIVDEMIGYYLNNRTEIDYLSNRQYTNFPEGLDTEIFSKRIIQEALRYAEKQEELEHINYFFLYRNQKYKIRYFNQNTGFDYSKYKLSIDTKSDLSRIQNLFFQNKLKYNFSFIDLINVLTNLEKNHV